MTKLQMVLATSSILASCEFPAEWADKPNPLDASWRDKSAEELHREISSTTTGND